MSLKDGGGGGLRPKGTVTDDTQTHTPRSSDLSTSSDTPMAQGTWVSVGDQAYNNTGKGEGRCARVHSAARRLQGAHEDAVPEQWTAQGPATRNMHSPICARRLCSIWLQRKATTYAAT